MKQTSDITVKVGLMVRYYRESANMTQEQLSFETGLHRTYIGQIERAEKNATIKSIQKIAEALGLDIRELFDFSKLDKFI